jgi:hydrogenase expression/formation protein HypC
MCLAMPGKILKIEKEKGLVDFGKVSKQVILSLVPDAAIGDWVLVHAGFGIQKVSEQDALETLKVFNELME